VKAVGQSVGFEKTTASLAEGQADKRMTQDLELLFNWLGCWFGLKCFVEKLDKARQTKLVHVVQLYEVAQNHKQIGPDVSEFAIDFSLLVKADLKFFGFSEWFLDLTALDLSLVQAVYQSFVL